MKHVGGELPADVSPYRRTPTFTEATVPAALTREHSTKAGVWGLLTVLSGKLRYVVPDEDLEHVLEPDHRAVIKPEQIHYVRPVGKVQFYVEFWK